MEKDKTFGKEQRVKQKAEGNKNKGGGISLRIQLMIGFAVPILFLIGVGIISYRSASSGMIQTVQHKVRLDSL